MAIEVPYGSESVDIIYRLQFSATMLLIIRDSILRLFVSNYFISLDPWNNKILDVLELDYGCKYDA
jgi:hypothetical protein